MTYFRPVGLVWVEPARCWRYGLHVFLVFSRPEYAMVIVLLEFYRLIYGLVVLLLVLHGL